MKIFIYSLIVIISIFLSCDNPSFNTVPVRQRQSLENKISSVDTTLLSLELDSLTSPMIHAIQQFSENNNEYLIYLNEETAGLYLNDLKTKKIVKKIKILDSLDDRKKRYQGFYYHNRDSIFMIAFGRRVTLINSSC